MQKDNWISTKRDWLPAYVDYAAADITQNKTMQNAEANYGIIYCDNYKVIKTHAFGDYGQKLYRL
jgi:hypothetical protein